MELRERIAAVTRDAGEDRDAFAEVRARVHAGLIEDLGPALSQDDVDGDVLRGRVRHAIRARLAQEAGLSMADRDHLIEEILDDTLGAGPLEPLLGDDSVTEIMVNGPHDVWVERRGKLHPTAVRFADDAHLRRIINKIVAQIGRRVDEASPMVDARLPDGSRVNAIIPPLSLSGPLLTVRKFSRRRLDLEDLIKVGSLTDDAAAFLRHALNGALNVLVSGGTGSGKTTLLNAMSAAISDDERIVTIEDAAELRLNQRHVLRLEARPRNIEGEGEVAIRDLVRNALRMRPDRIIVGEVRGAEALDMLQAMNTGHDGSLSTIHSNSARDALARLETMVLMAGYDLPVRAIRQQVASALDLIVHLERMKDGSRRVTSITEVQRMEGDTITTQDLFLYQVDDVTGAGTVLGALRSTGLRPTFTAKLERHGVRLPLPGDRAGSVASSDLAQRLVSR